jgi:hypothetical protein
MPEKKTIERARRDKRQGKSASTQAGEFVREEIEHIREGQHGVRSTRQAIAIGLSKARRAGVKLPAPAKGKAPESTRKQAKQELAKVEREGVKPPSRRRSRATIKALQRESRRPVSKAALSRQARTAAKARTPAERSAAAKRAARTRKAHRT